jgi:peptidoglycan/xylan/chitin deacetylase (PgdA/CDA1 family)
LLPTPDGVDRRLRVPILMYHHIEQASPQADAVRRDLSVGPIKFEEQLRYLRNEGYESITLNDLALHLTTGYPLPPKPIILTFDDGYADAYTHAFPILKRLGFTGTFFLMSAPIDAGNPDFLSWDQVQEMHAAGMRFEAHSYNHPDLRNRGFQFLVFQVLAPKEAIEARTGEKVRFYAYPSGRYDSFVMDVLRSAHYWGAVPINQGAIHATDDPCPAAHPCPWRGTIWTALSARSSGIGSAGPPPADVLFDDPWPACRRAARHPNWRSGAAGPPARSSIGRPGGHAHHQRHYLLASAHAEPGRLPFLHRQAAPWDGKGDWLAASAAQVRPWRSSLGCRVAGF